MERGPGGSRAGGDQRWSSNINGQTLPEATPDKLVVQRYLRLDPFDPGKLTLSTSVIWKAATYGSLFNRPYSLAPDYTLLNFRLTFRDAKDRYSVIGYVNNALDAQGFDGATGTLLQTGTAPGAIPGIPEIILNNRSYTAPRDVRGRVPVPLPLGGSPARLRPAWTQISNV